MTTSSIYRGLDKVMNVLRYMELAATVSRLKEDDRTYFHGAVCLRKDGVLVAASNGNPKFPEPKHHCEYRISRKSGANSTIFLVRTLSDGTWGNSKPCIHCENRLKHMKVDTVYYSTGLYIGKEPLISVWSP